MKSRASGAREGDFKTIGAAARDGGGAGICVV